MKFRRQRGGFSLEVLQALAPEDEGEIIDGHEFRELGNGN